MSPKRETELPGIGWLSEHSLQEKNMRSVWSGRSRLMQGKRCPAQLSIQVLVDTTGTCYARSLTIPDGLYQNFSIRAI